MTAENPERPQHDLHHRQRQITYSFAQSEVIRPTTRQKQHYWAIYVHYNAASVAIGRTKVWGIYAHSNATKNTDAETPPRQVPRGKEERARKKEDRGEVPRKTAAGGKAATTSSFMQLAHCCGTDGRVIVSYEP